MANVLTDAEKEKNAAKIAKVAIKLFKESSYNQISMNQIAQNAGLSKGTLFNYYKNKEDLFMTLLLVGYQEYFVELYERLKQNPLKSKKDLEIFLIGEVSNLIKNYSSLVRLNALRGPIFEGKANLSRTKLQRKKLYQRSDEVSNLINKQIGQVDTEELNHIFVIQSAIISGMLNLAGLEDFRGKPTGQSLPSLNIDVTKEATEVFKSYLKDKLRGKNETKEY